jgi:hypothetical protein
MEMYPVPEKCLTGTLNNFLRASAIDRSPQGEAFQDNALRFASHEESYVIEGFS